MIRLLLIMTVFCYALGMFHKIVFFAVHLIVQLKIVFSVVSFGNCSLDFLEHTVINHDDSAIFSAISEQSRANHRPNHHNKGKSYYIF
jgi:hypothetical protein